MATTKSIRDEIRAIATEWPEIPVPDLRMSGRLVRSIAYVRFGPQVAGGVLRWVPKVLTVSSAIWRHLSPYDRRQVVGHELAHVSAVAKYQRAALFSEAHGHYWQTTAEDMAIAPEPFANPSMAGAIVAARTDLGLTVAPWMRRYASGRLL